MTGALADHNKSTKDSYKRFHIAMAIPTAFYFLAWVYPVYANVWNKNVLDGHRETDLNVDERHVVRVEGEKEGRVERGETVEMVGGKE